MQHCIGRQVVCVDWAGRRQAGRQAGRLETSPSAWATVLMCCGFAAHGANWGTERPQCTNCICGGVSGTLRRPARGPPVQAPPSGTQPRRRPPCMLARGAAACYAVISESPATPPFFRVPLPSLRASLAPLQSRARHGGLPSLVCLAVWARIGPVVASPCAGIARSRPGGAPRGSPAGQRAAQAAGPARRRTYT